MHCISRLMGRSLLIAGLMFGGLVAANAQQPSTQQPDNTGVNKRDRQSDRVTADQQKENASDREISQQIRKALMNDKSLSTYAHNVKVITQDGTVTLKGPVRSEEEKKAIEAKATEVAGRHKVTSELEVKPEQ
jgi:hyperosmotically inducible protein